MELAVGHANGWGLSTIQFGVNEIASSLVVSKFIGSVLSHSQDAQVFDALERHFGVRVHDMPSWLQDVKLQRHTSLFGQNTRRVDGPRVMEDVRTNQLRGLATFVMLCVRYTGPKPSIVGLLETLICGALGKCVSKGSLQDGALPYNSKDAKQWMADLLKSTQSAWQRKRYPSRDRQATLNVSAFLLGGTSVEEKMTKFGQTRSSQFHPKVAAGRFHDTLQISSAYIALAAAANGANAIVECMTPSGPILIPRGSQRDVCTFVVRLWLTQPPPEILNVFKYSDRTLSERPEDRYESYEAGIGVTIFGGIQEVSLFAAQLLGYRGQTTDLALTETVRLLWNEDVGLLRNAPGK